jgi:hypothetical protein
MNNSSAIEKNMKVLIDACDQQNKSARFRVIRIDYIKKGVYLDANDIKTLKLIQ